MAVKPKSSVKSKAASKPRPAVKKKAKAEPNKKLNSPQNDFANLAEEIISNVSVGIYIVQNGKFVYTSPLFQRLSGYSHSDLLGTNPLDHVHPEDRETVRQKAIKSLQVKGKGDSYEYRFIRKNGNMMLVLEMVSSITHKGKRAALGSFMDITEHKRMETDLRRSEEKYRTILEEMDEGYFEIDLAGNFTFVNDAECRNMGYSREELIGMNNRQYTDKENAKKVYNAFINIYKTGETRKIFDYEIIKKDGTKAVSELLVSLVKDSKGKPIGFRGISRQITERKRIEDELRRSEEKHRTILDNIEDGYAEIDLRGNFIFFNEALCVIQGYPREELMKMSYRDLMDEENAKQIREKYNKVYTTGESEKEVPYEIMTKSGMRRYLETSINPMKDASGRIFAFRGIVRDTTERKRAEKALQKSEEKYRNILESIQEGYFELDLAGNYNFVNDANCRYLGYTKEELIGMNSRKLSDDENFKKAQQYYSELYRTGKPIEKLELECLKKDGTTGIYETSVTLIRDNKGKPVGFRGVSRDMSERKQAEKALSQSEERYRTIIEQMADGYFETDLAGKFTFVNDAECRNLGYTREELIGQNRKLYTDEKSGKASIRLFSEVYETKKPVTAYDLEIAKKDGTKAIHEISVSLIRNSQGEATGFRGISRDVTNRKQMEEKIRQSEERYRTIIEQMEEGYFETDLSGHFTFVNDAECRNLGYTREELFELKRAQFAEGKNHKALIDLFIEVYKTGMPVKAYDLELTKKDGTKSYDEISISLIRNSQGEPIGFRGIARDVSERKLLEEKIRQSEERYRTIIEEMEEWYFETGLTGNITFFNDIFSNLLGYSPEELTGLNFRDFIKKEDLDSVYRLFNQVFKTGKPTKNFPYEFVRPDGTVTSAEFSIFPRRDREAKIVGFRGVGHDITERKRAEEKIQYLATHDALTGLPNRLMFNQLLNHAIQAARRYTRQFAVLFIDLDRFKIINDTLGHEAGDQLLQEIAARLKQTLRAVDIVARLGGDEFVILIEELTDLSQLETVSHRILSAVIKPMTLIGEECRITASIGISIFPKDAEDEQSLMKNADIAMYFAKEEGKNNFQFYSMDIQSKSLERLSIETHLRYALEKNELSLHYQAKVDFKTNVITGVEALLRWQNPSLGSVSPMQFIPVAEETGLIVSIGKWVMKMACEQNVAWQKQGLPVVCIAVNLSLRQLMDDNLIDDIRTALNDSGMAPNLLELEITESMVMHNPTRMIAVLAKIKSLGVRLAIDDFGTGYSSLAQIKHFPVDTLKVDRSFIRNIPQDAEDKAITEAIIAMGKTLSLTVVAEGVETLEQMNFLKEHSCDEMQGYYFSKPIVPEQFADLLRKHVPSPQK